jgi:hypothetical protein
MFGLTVSHSFKRLPIFRSLKQLSVISTGAAEAGVAGNTSAPATAKTARIFTFRSDLNIGPPGYLSSPGTVPGLL